MSKEVGAGGRSDIFLDSVGKHTPQKKEIGCCVLEKVMKRRLGNVVYLFWCSEERTNHSGGGRPSQ